jgi:hypothetical protein
MSSALSMAAQLVRAAALTAMLAASSVLNWIARRAHGAA